MALRMTYLRWLAYDAVRIPKQNGSSRFGRCYAPVAASAIAVCRAYETLTSKWIVNEAQFGSMHIALKPEGSWSEHELEVYLKDAVATWRNSDKRSVLLKVPICQSHLIRGAHRLGFAFHHAKQDYSVLMLWLVEHVPNKVPAYANHTVGVAGICVHDNRALVVQDKDKLPMWSLPGGYAEPKESIGETAVRECWEETGVLAEFQSVLTLRHMHDCDFGQSNLLFVCRLRPVTTNIRPCQGEIYRAEWLDLDTLAQSAEGTPLTKLVCKLVLQGRKYGFDTVDINTSSMDKWWSQHKSEQFFVYHRPLMSTL